MKFDSKFNSNLNYIGNSPKLWKLTNSIYIRYKFINYTAFIHDKLYTIMLNERGKFNKFILKICFDLVFLVVGVLRGVKKFQFIGVWLLILLFIILIVSTPYYFWKLKKKDTKLNK